MGILRRSDACCSELTSFSAALLFCSFGVFFSVSKARVVGERHYDDSKLDSVVVLSSRHWLVVVCLSNMSSSNPPYYPPREKWSSAPSPLPVIHLEMNPLESLDDGTTRRLRQLPNVPEEEDGDFEAVSDCGGGYLNSNEVEITADDDILDEHIPIESSVVSSSAYPKTVKLNIPIEKRRSQSIVPNIPNHLRRRSAVVGLSPNSGLSI